VAPDKWMTDLVGSLDLPEALRGPAGHG